MMEWEIRYLGQIEQDLRKATEFEKALTPASEARRKRHVPWIGVAA